MARGDVFRKENGTWVLKESIKGPPSSDVGYIPVYSNAAYLLRDSHTVALFAGADPLAPWKNLITGDEDLTVERGAQRPIAGGQGSIAVCTPGVIGTPHSGFALVPSWKPNWDVYPSIKSANGAWEYSQFTVAMWLRRYSAAPTGNAVHPILTKRLVPNGLPAQAPYTAFQIEIIADEKLQLSLTTTGGAVTYATTLDALTVLPQYEWVLLSVVASVANGNLTLTVYCNGRAFTTLACFGTVAWATGGNASPWVLGAQASGGVCPDVYFGPVWFEDTARSAAWELARYQGGARRY